VKNTSKKIDLSKTVSSKLVKNAKKYAIKCHTETNHKYDGKPYETHLEMVVYYACKYSYMLPDNVLEQVIASAWTHDTIEDCRQTYEDVKNELGIPVAEITYALTNEKGRNRSQRANYHYYKGIVDTPFAGYVKLCDRLANVKYSTEQNSSMIELYRSEHYVFRSKLNCIGFKPMWDELNELLDENKI
jgi:(p)ppGpp synthase/HD superfamily hydrolase